MGERYVPTPEQRAAQEARRQAQAAAKEAKRHQVIPGTVKRLPLSTHLNRNQMVNAGLSTLAAGGLLHASRDVRKADDRRRNQLLGAAGGVAAADAASVVGGQSAKAVLMRRRAARGETPFQQETWGAHKQKHGLKPGEEPTGHTPAKVKHGIYTQYPKELPDWKAQRVLGWKNSARGTAAILGTGALAGAAYGGRKEKVGKLAPAGFALLGGATGATGLGVSARRRSRGDDEGSKEAIGAAAGTAAGQGLYQGAGYGYRNAVRGIGGSKVPLHERDVPKSKLPKDDVKGRKAYDQFRRERRELRAKHPDPVEYKRNTPKHWHGAQMERRLAWTHGGKTGRALGGAVTGLGALIGAEAASSKKSPFQGEQSRVGKADRTYGYMEERRNGLRTAGMGVGAGVAAWGASRLHVGPLVTRGARLATEKGVDRKTTDSLVARGRRVRDTTRKVTGQAEGVLRGRVPGFGTALDAIPAKHRAAAATGAGGYLMLRSHPTKDERFVSTGRW